MTLRLLRATLAASLAASARLLSAASSLTGHAAAALRPAPGRDAGPVPGPGPYGPVTTAQVLEEIDQQARERAAAAPVEGPTLVEGAPPVGAAPAVEAAPPVAEPADRGRRPESSIAGLAERPAAEIVKAVAELSTDELRLLYEYETAHRNRKTVLRAIERAAEPAPD